MKSSGFFVLGIALGVVGTLMFERIRKERDPEDFDLLSARVKTHLQQLEDRLESVMHPKTPERV